MAVDLPVARDLSLIFERDDVHDAFAGHCVRSHGDADDVRRCDDCRQLRRVLANAIFEWKALCDLELVAEPPRQEQPE